MPDRAGQRERHCSAVQPVTRTSKDRDRKADLDPELAYRIAELVRHAGQLPGCLPGGDDAVRGVLAGGRDAGDAGGDLAGAVRRLRRCCGSATPSPVSRLLRRAVGSGEFPPGTDCAAPARECIAVSDGLQLQWVLSGGRLDLVGAVRAHLDRLPRTLTGAGGL